MSGYGPGWSGNSHLWWTGGAPGATLSVTLPGIAPGAYRLVLFPTTARDYGRIKVQAHGEQREAELYTEQVLPGRPIEFEKLVVGPDQPLRLVVEITGRNDAAVPAFMVGLDRLELTPLK
jgi:hypothetical protein